MWAVTKRQQKKQSCKHQGQGRRRGRRCSRHQSRYSSAAYGRDHTRAETHNAAQGRPCPAAGKYALKEAVACGETTQEQAPGRCCSPWRSTHTAGGSPVRNCSSWRTHAGRRSFILLDCSPWRGPTLKQFVKDCKPRDPQWSRRKA